MSAPKTLEDITKQLATALVDVIEAIRHDHANLQQQLNHHNELIKSLSVAVDKLKTGGK